MTRATDAREGISDGDMLSEELSDGRRSEIAGAAKAEGLYDEGAYRDSDVTEVALDATQTYDEAEETEDGRPTFVLDGAHMRNRDALWDEVLDTLPLPDYTGRNLDALADSLWELPPCDIHVHAAGLLMGTGEPLRGYGQQLLDTLTDVASARGTDLNLTIER